MINTMTDKVNTWVSTKSQHNDWRSEHSWFSYKSENDDWHSECQILNIAKGDIMTIFFHLIYEEENTIHVAHASQLVNWLQKKNGS